MNLTVPFAPRRLEDDDIAISKYPEIMKLENLVANHQFKVPEMDHDVETKSTICTGNFTIPHDLPVTKENAYRQASSFAAPYPSSKDILYEGRRCFYRNHQRLLIPPKKQ